MGNAGHHGIDNGGVGEEHLLDLAGRNVVAPPDDEVLRPPGDPEEAVVVEIAEVPAEQPPVPPRLPCLGVSLVIPSWRPRFPHDDLAHLSRWRILAVFVHDPELDPWQGESDRAQVTPAVAGRGAAHRTTLGQAVTDEYVGPRQPLAEALQGGPGHGCTADGDGSQAGEVSSLKAWVGHDEL